MTSKLGTAANSLFANFCPACCCIWCSY